MAAICPFLFDEAEARPPPHASRYGRLSFQSKIGAIQNQTSYTKMPKLVCLEATNRKRARPAQRTCRAWGYFLLSGHP